MTEQPVICSKVTASTSRNPFTINVLTFLLAFLVITQQQCCTKFQNSKCVECPSGTHLYINNCLLDIANCVRYSGGFYCTKCQEGYTLMDDNSCVGQFQKVNITQADVPKQGFIQLTKQQILSTDLKFISAFDQLHKVTDTSQYKKEDILHVYRKPLTISNEVYEIYRIISQTKAGFDDILFSSDSTNAATILTKKSFNKITQKGKYEFADLRSDPFNEFILMQISSMEEFVRDGESIFDKCQQMDSYVVQGQQNGTVVNSFLIYFVSKDYGLIEVGFDLQVYEKDQSSNTTSPNNTETDNNTLQSSQSVQNSTNSQTTNSTNEKEHNTTISQTNTTVQSASNSSNTNSTTNNNSLPSNKTENILIKNQTLNNTTSPSPGQQQPTNTTSNSTVISTNNSAVVPTNNTNIIYLRSLMSIFNYTSLDNYTQFNNQQFTSSSITPHLIDFLLQNRPTLNKIYHPTTNNSADYLVDAAYKILSVMDVLLDQKQKSLVAQETIDQFQKEIELDLLICVVYRLTYEVQELQPYQIKVITVAKLNDDKNYTANTTTHNDVNSSTIKFMKIVQQIGRPQSQITETKTNSSSPSSTTTTNTSNTTTTTTATAKVIQYPAKQQQFIQRVQFFLQMQYPQLMQNAQLVNASYEQLNKKQSQIMNLTTIKDVEIRKMEEKNQFSSTYRVYQFVFSKVNQEENNNNTKTYLKWKIQYKDNQLDFIEVPKEVASSSGGSSQQPHSSSTTNTTTNSTVNSSTNSSTNSTANSSTQQNQTTTNNSSSQTNSTTNNNNSSSSTDTSKSTITSETSQQQIIYTSLNSDITVPVTDRYITQLDKLLKSFYGTQLSGNHSAGRYSMVLVGLKNKYIINTTLVVNTTTNTTFSNVSKTQNQKVYRLWYLITRFNNNNNNSDSNTTVVDQSLSTTIDNEIVYGYELGVSAKGLVTLYKVNVMKRKQFATMFVDYISGKVNNASTTSVQTSKQALKQALIVVENLQPNVESFTTNKIIAIAQSNSNNTQLIESNNQHSSQQQITTTNTLSNSSQLNSQTSTNSTKQIYNPSPYTKPVQNNTQQPVRTILPTTPSNLTFNLDNVNQTEKPTTNDNTIEQNTTEQLVRKQQELVDHSLPSVNDSQASGKTQSSNAAPDTPKSNSDQVNNTTQVIPYDSLSQPVITQTSINPLPPSINNLPPPIKPTIINPIQPSTPPFPPINYSFTNIDQFRETDRNYQSLISFIALVDPSKESSDQSDIRVVHRVLWDNNYLRYLIIYKSGSDDANESNDSTKDIENETFYDDSPLYVFELEIQDKGATYSTVNPQTHDDTAGEVVIISINDQSKQKQYKNIINSNANDNSNDSNVTNPSIILSDYYYYDKSLTITPKGASLQQQQHTLIQQGEQVVKSRLLQELMDHMKVQQIAKSPVNQQQAGSNIINTPRPNISNTPVPNISNTPVPNISNNPTLPNQNLYPSLTTLKGESLMNLRKQQTVVKSPQPALTNTPITNTSKESPKTQSTLSSNHSNQKFLITRKWLGLLQVQKIPKDQISSQATLSTDSSSSIKRFYQKHPQSTSLHQQLPNRQQYSIVTILLQLPLQNVIKTNNTVMGNVTTNNITINTAINTTINSTANNTKQTYPNITLTLSLNQFIISISNQSAQLSAAEISQTQPAFKQIQILSSSFINRQNYRFGKQLTSNKKIDEFIKKKQLKSQSRPSAITSQGNSIIIPKKIALLDPYFKASQQFVIWDKIFFLKSYTQNQIKVTFIQPKANSATNTINLTQSVSPSSRQNEFFRLIVNLESYNASSPQSSRHLSDFQFFMARNFKSIVYEVKYMLPNYVQNTAEEWNVKVEYNDFNKKYDVTEMKLIHKFSMIQIEDFLNFEQNYRLLDPSANCLAHSKQSKLKCLKCKDGYLLTNFYDIFAINQSKQFSNGSNDPTACSKKIANCRRQFLDGCIDCIDGYDKLSSTNAFGKGISQQCIKKQ